MSSVRHTHNEILSTWWNLLGINKPLAQNEAQAHPQTLCWAWGLQQHCCGAKHVLFCFKAELTPCSEPFFSLRQTSLYPCLLSSTSKTFWFIKVWNIYSFNSFNSSLPLLYICSPVPGQRPPARRGKWGPVLVWHSCRGLKVQKSCRHQIVILSD